MFSINTGKNMNSALPPSWYEIEQRYKSILDLSSKLNVQINESVISFHQLYSSSILNLRNRLCEEVKIIYRFAPVQHGTICEELLWKRNYYDYVRFVKKHRKQLNSTELIIFRQHLVSGIGYYQSLILSFRKVFNLKKLDTILRCAPFNFATKIKKTTTKSGKTLNLRQCNSFGLDLDRKNATTTTTTADNDNDNDNDGATDNNHCLDRNEYIGDLDEADDADQELLLEQIQDETFLPAVYYLIHRFCICLGDLARYYVDFFNQNTTNSSRSSSSNSKHNLNLSRFNHYYFHFASYYYKVASMLQPNLGMPFNQLGTLYTGSYWGLDTLYYYSRCRQAVKPFAGVEGNMKQTFETVRNIVNLSTTKRAKVENSNNVLVRDAVLAVMTFFSKIHFRIENMQVDNKTTITVDTFFVLLNSTLAKLEAAINVEPPAPAPAQQPSQSSSSSSSAVNDTAAIINRHSPSVLSTESVFQIFNIFLMLIDQIKKKMNENAIEVQFGLVKCAKPGELLSDNQRKVNFFLLLSYRFLFQLATLLVKHEKKVLSGWLQKLDTTSWTIIPKTTSAANNKMISDSIPCKGKKMISSSKGDENVVIRKKKPIFAHSFSSDFGDIGEDSAMLNQLKSTALQSIVALFDQSDNEEGEEEQEEEEEEEEMKKLNDVDDETDNESVSDLIDKLIFSDDDDDEIENLGGGSGCLIDQALDRNNQPQQQQQSAFTSSRSVMVTTTTTTGLEDQQQEQQKQKLTMDQILFNIYVRSHMPVIKFLCDYLQASEDFLELLPHLDILYNFFGSFFDYLNVISEFDFKLATNFKQYFTKRLATGDFVNEEQVQTLLQLNNLINQTSTESIKNWSVKFPLSTEVDYLRLTAELSTYFDHLYGAKWNEDNIGQQVASLGMIGNEKFGYICARSILVFGVKLALLSLNTDTFKLSLEDYGSGDESGGNGGGGGNGNDTLHNFSHKRRVNFIFYGGISDTTQLLSPIESNNSSLTVSGGGNGGGGVGEPLISFVDVCNDNNGDVMVMDNNNIVTKTSSSAYHHKQQQKPKEKKKVANNFNNHTGGGGGGNHHFVATPANSAATTIAVGNNDYKSLNAISKLPYVTIDPYVYLESMDFIRNLVAQKKAFLVVPQLASDFLNNLKDKNMESAREASDFLTQEFFRGTRTIRFIRTDDRLELDLLKYPRIRWRRDLDTTTTTSPTGGEAGGVGKPKPQDVALFYELLETCHYLLVNKVLVDRSQEFPTFSNANATTTTITNGDAQHNTAIRITLLTNNLAKWPAGAVEIARAYGIDLETVQSFLEKTQTNSGGNSSNNHHHNNKSYHGKSSSSAAASAAASHHHKTIYAKSKKDHRHNHHNHHHNHHHHASNNSPMYFKPIQNARTDGGSGSGGGIMVVSSHHATAAAPTHVFKPLT